MRDHSVHYERFQMDITASTSGALDVVWRNLTRTKNRIAALIRKVTHDRRIRVMYLETGRFVVRTTKCLLGCTKQIADIIRTVIGKIHPFNVSVECHRINTPA